MANVVTNSGKAVIANRIIGAGTEPKYIGWGTGAGTAVVADTTLFTEDSAGSPAYARASGTGTRVTVTVGDDTHQIVGTITSNATKTITNAGVFDALTVGNLYCKGDFAGIALANGDAITFTMKIQFT